MLRTLALLTLLTPAAALAQEARDIAPGQTLTGTLSAEDRTQFDRAYDEFLYAAEPGAEARVVVQSDDVAVDVNVYFFDDYFDLIPLHAGGSVAKDALDFTVPAVDTPTLVVFRVTTLANDPGLGYGAYSIALSIPQDR